MKKFGYIFLFLVFVLSGKSFSSADDHLFTSGFSKETKLTRYQKQSDISTPINFTKKFQSNFKKERRPKKPKGIKVLVPNVSTQVFQKFYRYSDFRTPEIQGYYSFLLHYSHGKRGPPSYSLS